MIKRNFVKRKYCVCEKPAYRDEKTEAGKTVATYCSLCTLPVILFCEICGKPFKDVNRHIKASHPKPVGETPKQGLLF